MTIASASLLYAYYSRFPKKNYLQRSTRSVKEEESKDVDILNTVYETYELLESLDDSLTLLGVTRKHCQLRAVCDIIQDKFPSPAVDTVSQVIKITVSKLRKIGLDLVQPVISVWLMAAEEGKRGDDCHRIYHHCQDPFYERKILFQNAF